MMTADPVRPSVAFDLAGPFGTPDGSRAHLDTRVDQFVDLDDHPGFGALATKASDASVRVIVGKMGAGKTVYMRRLASFQEAEPAVYADRPQQSIPQTELIVRVAEWYQGQRTSLTEKWMQLWTRAILRSLATHLLAPRGLGRPLPPDRIETLRRDYGHLIGDFRRPRSVYAELREVINDHNSGAHLTRFMENPDWEDLESELAELLWSSKPVFFYLDAIDDAFNAAPRHWLRCHEGLFLAVMQLLRDARLGSRLHVVIAVRDLVLSSIFRSEHGPRYHDEPHIRVLQWGRDAVEFLFLEKIRRLEPTYQIAPSMGDPVQAWLGTNWVHNERRGVDEQLLDYMIRHTRLIPRDVVSLGNALTKAVHEQKQLGRSEFPPEVLRSVVSMCAKRFGESQLSQCASQISADMMPNDAVSKGYADVYLSNAEYKLGIQAQIKDILGAIGVDRFNSATLVECDSLAANAFEAATQLSSVLWQNGLLGYVDAGRSHFFAGPDISDWHVPRDAESFVLHPCVLDTVRGVRCVGRDPVYPYITY